MSILSSTKTGKKAFFLYPKNKYELITMIEKEIKEKGNKCSLNHIDTSKIENMSWLFSKVGYSLHDFDGDISKWDVSNVKQMEYMFERSSFKGDISNWKINPFCSTYRMFLDCKIKDEYKPKDL